MAGPSNGAQAGGLEREPVRTATGITAGVAAILTAFFLVARDLGVSIPGDTQAAITGALTIIVLVIANEWARRRSTPTAAPVLPAGTPVTTPAGVTATVSPTRRTDT